MGQKFGSFQKRRPGPGNVSHTQKWKRLIPTSFRSPYFSQGDLGFFSYQNKTYGSFFLGVNTFTGRIFVTKISNNKMDTLISAVGKMLKVIK